MPSLREAGQRAPWNRPLGQRRVAIGQAGGNPGADGQARHRRLTAIFAFGPVGRLGRDRIHPDTDFRTGVELFQPRLDIGHTGAQCLLFRQQRGAEPVRRRPGARPCHPSCAPVSNAACASGMFRISRTDPACTMVDHAPAAPSGLAAPVRNRTPLPIRTLLAESKARAISQPASSIAPSRAR